MSEAATKVDMHERTTPVGGAVWATRRDAAARVGQITAPPRDGLSSCDRRIAWQRSCAATLLRAAAMLELAPLARHVDRTEAADLAQALREQAEWWAG
jgi:hypothetical protein